MTATEEREDNEDITEIFGKPIVDIKLPEAIAKGWLTPVDYRVLSDGLNEDKIAQLVQDVLVDNVRITEKQINERIFIKFRTEEQVKQILKESKNKQAIVFCKNVEHLKHVATLLPSCSIHHSKQTQDENKKAKKLFIQKKVRHILVVDQFNEGIDIPNVELLVFMRGTNSKRIFLQQLGRGLRLASGKKKVTVLDFVGNIRRLEEVRRLVQEVESFTPKGGGKKIVFDSIHLDGKGFNFKFTEKLVDLMKVFDRSQEEFYRTWEEAREAVIKLGIKTFRQYFLMYKKDLKLSGNPSVTYKDFPGWSKYLGNLRPIKRKAVGTYSTWQEASMAAKKLKIKNGRQYGKEYIKDSKLPSDPLRRYGDFPGWFVFLGKNKYSTWQEASMAVQKLKIKTLKDYKEKYKQDLMLPGNPRDFYGQLFPGWLLFLGSK